MKRLYGILKRSVKSFLDNNCSTHAAGLTYFALLAVIPVLCCVLVVAKACNVDEIARTQINAKIDALIVEIEHGQDDPLVEYVPGLTEDDHERKRIVAKEFARQARVICNELFERVAKFDIGTLGWIGFGFLLWTLISSLASVETSFNQIWDVERSRPIWKRAYLYLFIMIVIPVLATVAMSFPLLSLVKNFISLVMGASWLTKWTGMGIVWVLDSSVFRVLMTLFFLSTLFGYVYWVLPNCPVRKRIAWIGGLVTAAVFDGWIRICAVAQVGIAKSSALYGSFAMLPIVLAWLYMSWQIILFGACFTREIQRDFSK